MTRINLVDVKHLTDKHLLAEYKEITRPFNKVINRINKFGFVKALDDVTISSSYVLGTGHESFFFDKLHWLWWRYFDLFEELNKRGFNIDEVKFKNIAVDLKRKLEKTKYWNDWNEYKPTPEEIYLNMSRLCKRSNLQSVINELKEV